MIQKACADDDDVHFDKKFSFAGVRFPFDYGQLMAYGLQAAL